MIRIIKENLSFVQQTLKLSKSTLIKTYKGSALGPLWAIIKPLVTVAVFYFALRIGLRNGGPVTLNGIKMPNFLWLVFGMLPWFFMSEAITEGANSIRANRHFITRLPFPVSTVITYTMLSKIYVQVFLTFIMYIVYLCMGYAPSWYHLQYIFWYLPLMFLFFTFLAWITAPLSTVSVDFLNIVRAILTAIFWISGIIYNANAIENPIVRRIVLANPINYFANGYRYTFLYKRWFWESKFETIVFILIFLVCMFLGAWVFNKLRKHLPDVM
jgi:ABC-type polysaccharide/polyol phosphate export permease